jgi:hypothetical protein
MRPIHLPFRSLLLPFVVLSWAGCASVDVTRVRDADYETHGFRFYRPRPYVVVNKSFPVAGDDFFLYGTVDAKNRVIAVDASMLPDPIKSSFISISQYRINIPFASVSGAGQPVVQQGLTPGATTPPAGTSPAPSTAKPGANAKAGQSDSKSVSATQPTTQEATLKTTSDPSVDPLEKVNDYISIIYLPDFDQQYAINASSGFGTASGSLQMKNGWMTEDASWNVDNRELGQFVFGNITKLTDLATTVAEQAVAPGSAELGQIATGLVQQGEVPPATVLLRVRYVLNASPGVYPLLKPAEAGNVDEALAGKRHILLPLPPYSVVAYNYTSTVAVELVSVSAASTPKSGPVGGSGLTTVPGDTVSLTGDDAKIVMTWLTAHPINGLSLDSKVPFGLTSDGTLLVPVVGAAPPATQDEFDASLAKDPVPTLSNGRKVSKVSPKATN